MRAAGSTAVCAASGSTADRYVRTAPRGLLPRARRFTEMISADATPEEISTRPACAFDVTVVLPCLDEAETLAICMKKAQTSMAQLGLAGEVIVPDNGSDAGPQDIARRMGARVVDVSTRGYGAALTDGITAPRSEFIVMADADGGYDLSDLGPFVEQLRNGADLVTPERPGGVRTSSVRPAIGK
jgi:Glycosyl transferase family 2